MALKVLRAGLLTTVQDLGRFGWQRYGVPVSGVMDELSHRVANMLVGNPEEEATLEMTITGPRLEFTEDTLFALCGGDFQPTIKRRDVPLARPVLAGTGAVLDIAHCRLGVRAYLAVAGGFELPSVLGSKSTYLPGAFGGFQGRALKRGDCLLTVRCLPEPYPTLRAKLSANGDFAAANWSADAATTAVALGDQVIRFVAGRDWERFPAEWRERFMTTAYRIAADSDRMGYRLEGPTITLPDAGSQVSEGVAFGSIQVPPDGRPIVLMANRQTTGGYPRVGEVAAVDLPRLAQLRPGQTVRMAPIDLRRSQALYLERERELARMREAVRMRLRQ